MKTLSHFTPQGAARMVNVGAKPQTLRLARAAGRIVMQADTLSRVLQREMAKGEVLAVARIAGITGAKRAHEWIPLTHPLSLTAVSVEFEVKTQDSAIECTSCVQTVGRTGVEMEALSAVTAALLTIYDMCKAADRAMVIEAIRLLEKQGGRSGHWVAADP